jgi:hypothetical protein
MAEPQVEPLPPNLDARVLTHLMADMRRRLPYASWIAAADLFAETVRKYVSADLPAMDDAAKTFLNRIHVDGLAQLGPVLGSEHARDLREYFASQDCFNGHVYGHSDKRPRRIGHGAETFHYASYRPQQILAAPYLLELANDLRLVTIAANYLGCLPSLYSINAWWSFPGQSARAEYAQQYHRDEDDFRFLTLFVYLTDVESSDGAHCFVRGSHNHAAFRAGIESARRKFDGQPAAIRPADIDVDPDQLFERNGYPEMDALIDAAFGDRIERIHGPAGTGFLANTFAFHKGLTPTRHRRLAVSFRYGLGRNSVSISDEIEPQPRALYGHRIGDDPLHRYVCRWLIEP